MVTQIKYSWPANAWCKDAWLQMEDENTRIIDNIVSVGKCLVIYNLQIHFWNKAGSHFGSAGRAEPEGGRHTHS